MNAGTGRRPAGALESEVMGVLWAHDGPLTATEVHGAVGGGLAYNTVLTILTRLYEKHLIERRRAGRSHVYWPSEDAATAAAGRMRAALAGRADRRAVLRNFAASLTDDDAAALRDLLSRDPARRPRNQRRDIGASGRNAEH